MKRSTGPCEAEDVARTMGAFCIRLASKCVREQGAEPRVKHGTETPKKVAKLQNESVKTDITRPVPPPQRS